ncbi:replicative helicase loader/inhibitor [Neobacillus sp. WH10]|uniref:replicative helicase loader/inhibitor n=1 Tax=Neobacillus sp. WH10 TaxID=3047873 RepID=UPI0024C1394B|nr:replicative helicase loader/inhibitor [Neobacillus sp. WH10]WHY76093.1 replicative helicase loader/inhibitor [Neobacillus sp. WH10]
MTKKEVAELFKFIRSIYSSFEVDQYKINTWSEMLKDQNPATVMKKAERHVLENKFAPTIADLREARRREDPSVLAQFWSKEDYE